MPIRAQQAEQAQQVSTIHDVRILQRVAGDEQGWKWEVLIIKPGLGANRQYFPESTLRQAVPVFEGARVFCLDDEQHASKRDKSAKQIVGYLDQVRYADGQGLVGRLTLLPTGDWLRQALVASHQDKPDLFGLSIDAPGEARKTTIQQGGETIVVQEFTKITQPATVDVVWNPGTPGGFQRALNAVSMSHKPEEERMDKKHIIQILQASRPDLCKDVDLEAISDEQLSALLTKATAKQAEPDKNPGEEGQKEEEKQAAAKQAAAKQAAARQSDEARARQVDLKLWQWDVRQALDESKLPEACLKDLRARYMDQPGRIETVQQAIKAEREKIDAISQAGKVAGLGHAREISVEGEMEVIQAALDKLLGVKDVKGETPGFWGIRQAYVRITGDGDLAGRSSNPQRLERMTQSARAYQAHGMQADQDRVESGGIVHDTRFARIEQAQTSNLWPLLLANSMHRRLVQDYRDVDFGEDRIISNKRRATDFRPLEAGRTAYSSDLPDIDPEFSDYTEAPPLGEEGVNYLVSTKGRIMTVTRKMLINDDLGAVTRLPAREGRAARRTFARRVWNLYLNNAVYDGDAIAWFHALHGNLGAVALTADAAGISAMVAALNRLAIQTEPASGERLSAGWANMRPLLVIPQELEDKARSLNQSDGIPGTANNGDNPIRHIFGKNEDAPERIFVNPLFTDPNDWGLFRNPQDMEIIEVAFLNGMETPEVFVADQQTIGQMFVADKLQFKIRHEHGAEIVDFRSAQKNVV